MQRGLAAAACAAALAATGCGSQTLPDKELRTRAGAICARAAKLTAGIPGVQRPGDAGRFLAAGVGPLQAQESALRALKPSSELAQSYDSAVQALRAEVGALRDAAADLRRGADPTITVKTLQQRLDPLEQTQDDAWRALQVQACLVR